MGQPQVAEVVVDGQGSGGWLGRWWQSGESMKEGKVNSGEEEG